MSLILLPLNPAKDAVLVDINNQPLTIDDSTPIEVNVQQPVEIDDSDPLSVKQVASTYQRDTNSNIDELLSEILIQLKISNRYMSIAYDEDLTEEDIEE